VCERVGAGGGAGGFGEGAHSRFDGLAAHSWCAGGRMRHEFIDSRRKSSPCFAAPMCAGWAHSVRPGADVGGVGPVPAPMGAGWAHPRSQSRRRCGRGGHTHPPSPGADVGGARPRRLSLAKRPGEMSSPAAERARARARARACMCDHACAHTHARTLEHEHRVLRVVRHDGVEEQRRELPPHQNPIYSATAPATLYIYTYNIT
jgi:hypothetical protein